MEVSRDSGSNEYENPDISPEGADGRVKSTITFPSYDLNTAITLPMAIHEHFGSKCSPDQLAAVLNHLNAKSGSFGLKTAAGQQFGLISRDRSSFHITPLGLAVIHAESEVQAKITAFLTVALFQKVYLKYRGLTLPGDKGLESEMESMGVTQKSLERARQVFQRSAEQAGLFWLGRNRLVLPKGASDSWQPNSSQGQSDVVDSEPEDIKQLNRVEHEIKLEKLPVSHIRIEGLPPAVAGVLTTLPQPGAEWLKSDLDAWSEMFRQVLMISYGVKSEK